MATNIESYRVMAILHEALQRTPEQREAYIQAACEGDHVLYGEVADALQWEERMGSFLVEPLLDFTHVRRPFEPEQLIAERFEILREIGEGGMGVVTKRWIASCSSSSPSKPPSPASNACCRRS
jgi:hypothetical protein